MNTWSGALLPLPSRDGGRGATDPNFVTPTRETATKLACLDRTEYLEQQWFHLWRCNSEDHEYASTNVATLFPKVQEAVEEGGKHGVGVDTGYASFIDVRASHPSPSPDKIVAH